MNLQLQYWHVTASQYLGIAGLVYALTSDYSPWWFLLSFVGHMMLVLLISVVLHRLVVHAAFTPRLWMTQLLLLGSALAISTSPYSWMAGHSQHHALSDTDKDPHDSRWTRVFFLSSKTEVTVAPSVAVLRRVSRLNGANFSHHYAVAIIIAFSLLLAAVSPTVLLFAYLIPLGTSQVANGLQRWISHRGGKPGNYPFLELILPTAGEWYHKNHHDHPAPARYGKFDLGYQVIRMIAVPGSIK